MFVSLKFVVQNHWKLLRSISEDLLTQVYTPASVEAVYQNGIISWSNTNEANIKNAVLRHFQAILREFKYASGKRVC